ncbi:alpha-hydroxy acid oxidase [Ottowia thiooxydans]|uniref:(S)-mandelate dehydrogenase n=1 Tax=Ottowia thiooxydans TaxID=219182 RepID=A0ABV2Q5A1_9BURK
MHHALTRAHNLHDFRELAKRRLPRGVFEYIDRGAEDEVALRENRQAFERIRLKPRVLVDVTGRSAGASLFGQPLTMPVAVAPTGSAGLVWFQGELELAKAAAKAGIPFTLATAAMTSMETIAREAGGRLWFQLNMFADRSIGHAMVQRAANLGFEALVLTADCSVVPNREYNARNGFTVPFRMSARSAMDMLAHPRWLAGVMGRYALGPGMPKFENYPPELRTRVTGFSTSKSAARCEDLSWKDVQELRALWPRQLVIKGILRAGDALRAVELGADAVVVSNHGGRTVDGAIAPIDALPEIFNAVGGKTTILLDSGVRRGSDVVKARALGADAVLIGRPTLFGTALAGAEGGTHVLHILKTEIEREMGLLGCRTLADITPDLLAG